MPYMPLRCATQLDENPRAEQTALSDVRFRFHIRLLCQKRSRDPLATKRLDVIPESNVKAEAHIGDTPLVCANASRTTESVS